MKIITLNNGDHRSRTNQQKLRRSAETQSGNKYNYALFLTTRRRYQDMAHVEPRGLAALSSLLPDALKLDWEHCADFLLDLVWADDLARLFSLSWQYEGVEHKKYFRWGCPLS